MLLEPLYILKFHNKMKTNNLSCIIIDDETSGRIVLKELISLYYENINIIGEASNIETAYDLINQLKPDFIFLDIQMPGGNGFDLLRKFQSIEFDVVFVTSFDKYAINAIKFSAIDYLLKPIDVDELQSCISKIEEKKEKDKLSKDLVNNLLANINGADEDRKIAIHTLDKVKFINIKDIVYVSAEGNYCKITCSDNTKYTHTKTLKDIESMFSESTYFLRINKSIIINSMYVKNYSKGNECVVTMKNDETFELSRRKKAELNQVLEKFSL